MTEMTRSSMASVLAPEFDDFLFAPIGEERNGMLLSVISALARLDIDPWQEAANLAQLPGTTATRRLASLIAPLPDRPSPNLDPGTIAARLIARLLCFGVEDWLFSIRPSQVKRNQVLFRRPLATAARGSVLLFGISRLALPAWDQENGAAQSDSRPHRALHDRPKSQGELTPSIVPRGTSRRRWPGSASVRRRPAWLPSSSGIRSCRSTCGA
jgi:hypothetical protein